MVTVYDVSRSENDKLLHSNIPAYSIPPVSGFNARTAGYSISRSAHQSETALSIYQLSERGSIYCLELDVLTANSMQGGREVCQWSTEVQTFAQGVNVRPEMGPFEARVASKVDVRSVYER